MSSFVRFVAGPESENAYWLLGIITLARMLRDDGELYTYEIEWLESIYDWLNTHLPCPPFEQKLKSGEWTKDAVSWFYDNASEPLRKMWDLVAILREHDVPVRLVRTQNPGKIVYTDEYQVVAETPYAARHDVPQGERI